MIELDLQAFGGGKSGGGAGGTKNDSGGGGPKKTSKRTFGGSAGRSGTGSGGGQAAQRNSSGISDDNHVGRLVKGETYNLYRVREDGSEKYTDRDTFANINEELKGYHFDNSTGLWVDRYGRRYRVGRAK